MIDRNCEGPLAANEEPSQETNRHQSVEPEPESTADNHQNTWQTDPYADLPHPADTLANEKITEPHRFVDGATFILDRPEGIPAIWGSGNEVLWAQGETLMIAGPQGLGKTTLAGQLLRALIGLGDPKVLGLPVSLADHVLYLAMDRPSQITRAHGRIFTEHDRDTMARKLSVHRGPPPYDMAKRPDLLAEMCKDAGADVVIVDSLKDAAIKLSDDETGAAYNRARQFALESGVQIVELHHTIKRGPDGGKVSGINDIYGSTWLTSGCGSVILLTGNPGDPIVGMKHLKQPADEVGPLKLNHDQTRGLMTVMHENDIYELVRATGANGLTAKEAARALFDVEKPTSADIEKARRKLSRLADQNLLVSQEGAPRAGGGKPTTAWFLPMRAA